MILDQELVLAEAQAITTAATTPSQHVYDTGAAADVGIGEETYFVATVDVTLAGGTNVQALLQTSADNSSWETVVTGPLVVTANLAAGATLLKARLPIGLKRYIRAAFTSTGTYASGSVSAFIVMDAQAQQYLPSGV